MVQRKRVTGSSAKRRSTRNIKEPDPEVHVHNAEDIEEEPQTENLEPSPRKKAKTEKSSPVEEETEREEPMHDVESSAPPATGGDDANQEGDVAGSIQGSPGSKPQLHLSHKETKGKEPVDTDMEAESPLDEVSQQLEDVDIETPRKQKKIEPTPVARATRSPRSTRSKRNEQVDTDMVGELADLTAPEPPRRSARARKGKPEYDEDKYLDAAEKQLEQPPPKIKTPRKAPKGGVWSADHLLTSRRSKIITAECNMIFNENTWGLFTEEEKTELLSLLHPIDTEITFPDQDPALPPPRIPTPELFQNLNNDAFRTAFAELQEDLETGSYEPAYVRKAEEALRLRLGPMADRVDDVKNNEFEEYWGQKQVVFFGDAGLSAGITLYELCQQKMLRPGDVFEYKRTFQGGITVEKVCELDSVELAEAAQGVKKKRDASILTFRFPSKARKFLVGNREDDPGEGASAKAAEQVDKDIAIQVNNLAQLEVAILDEDGTVKASDPEKYAKQYPNGNAWKQFMVRRNDEFLGSVFTIRQEYYEKKAAREAA
ncbi:uncharacterized protein DFL_007690 [Arthrobotrys flagrans]|uniref:ASX DEUBAD domain-containing protein n=1 Tax=Arthrobotrys flagrans TaxID=97331 RepID=A0A436ZX40_ARTFL|nr:hypothetical protein DFL_007690 [Arthrobotrys flagrans]